MNLKPNILIVDDETKMLDILSINFAEDYNVFVAENGLEAMTILHQQPLNIIVSDLKMPKMNGIELLKYVKGQFPNLPFIIMTAYGTIEDAVEAIKIGAFDYLVKPIKIDDIRHIIEKTLSYFKLLEENKDLKKKLYRFEEYHRIVSLDSRLNKLLELAKQVAVSNVNVLITGESGTGKQLMAEFIHSMSLISNGPFIEINAGAIPHELLESELFGHEKGAFTGAVQSKRGKFELANNGTLFLDEIGELPFDLQVKLLHVVEQNKVMHVGGTREIPINVRLISATNRNLLLEIENKNFRSDLYYRLRVVSINIPPLRERQVDIPLLVKTFIRKHSGDEKVEYMIDADAMNILKNYPWPGNIRELENIIQQAMIFAKDGKITKDELPAEIKENITSIPVLKEDFQKIKRERVGKVISGLEVQFLNNLLSSTNGNITQASKRSGYDRRQLQNLIVKYHINTKNYKSLK